MASTLSPSTRAEFSEEKWSEPLRSVDLGPNDGPLPYKQPSLGRAMPTLARYLITFCIGVAATLAWQSYGDAAREMIANSSPQLGWLAPQAAPVMQAAPSAVAPAAPSALSPELVELKAGLVSVQQSVDQLAAQVAAAQRQMAGDIANLQAADQNILQKISAPLPRPAAPPARKPAPLTPPKSEAPPAH